ncbi:hypothetical protein ACHAQA_003740 [Verticillium albo-atrum]
MTDLMTNLSKRGTLYSDPANKSPMIDVVADPWHPESNPEGYVSLGVAENVLMHEELTTFINKNFAVDSYALTCGDGYSGSNALRTAIANFVTKNFHTVTPVLPQQVSVTSGVGMAGEALGFSLCDRGDGVLLGQPYYGSFPLDLSTRAGVNAVPVPLEPIDPFSIDAIAAYERVLAESNQNGVPIKALLLCNPHNPLGRCYAAETIKAYMRFCEKHSLHLICDEVYALSVWDNPDFPDAPRFTSVLSVDAVGLMDPSRIHIVWGMSKDFGSNGTRLGCAITQHNAPLLQSLETISYYSTPSSASDILTTNILTSTSFLESYFPVNHARLAAAHATIASFLAAHGIPHAKGGNAGFFLWVNLLQDATWEDEARFDRLLLRHKLFLASGKSFGSERPGWFRVVFSHEKPYLEEGLRRIVAALEAFKKEPEGSA